MIAPLLLFGLIFGGTIAAGTGVSIFEHETNAQPTLPVAQYMEIPPVTIPAPRPVAVHPKPKAKPHPAKPTVVAPVAPPPVITEEAPAPEAAPVQPEEPKQAPAPAPTTEPTSPVPFSFWGILQNLGWKLFWAAIFLICGLTSWRAIKSVIAIRKGDTK